MTIVSNCIVGGDVVLVVYENAGSVASVWSTRTQMVTLGFVSQEHAEQSFQKVHLETGTRFEMVFRRREGEVAPRC